MPRDNPYNQAMFAAEQVIVDHDISELAVDILHIASVNDIEVTAKPMKSPGVSGMLFRVGNNFGITYATHINSLGFQRFSIAHELGHYFLAGHHEAVLGNNGVHESRAGFSSSDSYEKEADHFAASLLMPNRLFSAAMSKAGEGIDAIEVLSSKCKTSFPATAIRFTQCAREPVAAIISQGDKIDYAFMSNELKEVDGIDWIKGNFPLPSSSETFSFNGISRNVAEARRQNGSSDFQDWFNGSRSFEIAEDVMGLGSYGKTLTILYDIELPDEDGDDDLEDSWTPRFRR
jgi:Zn-dependent peptidase ImmA (M78 family)